MKSFNRDTRAVLSNNPTGLLFKLVLPRIIKNIAGKLRAFRAAAVLFILFALFSCTKPYDDPTICVTGDCFAKFSIDAPRDSNGFYHVSLDYDGEYDPRFTIDGLASAISEEYRYGDQSVVSARFKGDKEIEIVIAEHLNQTEIIPVVQETQIYFSGNSSMLKTKRTVGPIPLHLKGDTLNIQAEVLWDAGVESILRNFSLKIILE
jgi:hypothetical protein